MKRYLVAALVAIALVVITLVVFQPSHRITVANHGTDVVEVKTDSSEKKTLLGQNAIGYFASDSKIHIGDALISVGRRVEVVNTGSDVIQVEYHDAAGSERTTVIGEGGSGYFSKITPINIDEVNIRVGNSQ